MEAETSELKLSHGNEKLLLQKEIKDLKNGNAQAGKGRDEIEQREDKLLAENRKASDQIRRLMYERRKLNVANVNLEEEKQILQKENK